MRTIKLCDRGQTSVSKIVCRKNVLSSVLAPMRERLLGGGGLLFTDSNVCSLYGKELERTLGGVPVFVMPAGEKYKNEETLFSLLRKMAEAGLRRNSALVAFGGGVVGDLGGLAASLYMRGISCVQVPTTLLAQVDSSVGGKTAVDLCGVKNLIGTFRQPELVLADPVFFKTLPPRELRCGLGEIVKHGALSPALFEKLFENRSNLFDLSFLAEIVPENIAFKASVVRQDPRERDVRRSLNLGHTTAHAFELGSSLSHGECVLLGLLFEGRIAARLCGGDGGFLARLESLVRAVLGELPPLPDLEGARSAALLDKKNRSAGKTVLTVPCAAGEYQILELPIDVYVQLLKEIAEELC